MTKYYVISDSDGCILRASLVKATTIEGGLNEEIEVLTDFDLINDSSNYLCKEGVIIDSWVYPELPIKICATHKQIAAMLSGGPLSFGLIMEGLKMPRIERDECYDMYGYSLSNEYASDEQIQAELINHGVKIYIKQ